MKRTVGVIGYGTMGSAIAERIKTAYEVYVFDKDSVKTKGLRGLLVAESIADALSVSEMVILAVKPQDFASVLAQIKSGIEDTLVVSIAAGITTSYIERCLGQARLVRVMPNLPAQIGQGMSCLCKGAYASDDDLAFAQALFQNLGKTIVIGEHMMNAATAVSGSSPGFLYDRAAGKSIAQIKAYAENEFIPELEQAARAVGFGVDEAGLLAAASASGSIAFLIATGIPADVARSRVASKGGTTEAGLAVLHNGGSLVDAVRAALKRAEELSKKG